MASGRLRLTERVVHAYTVTASFAIEAAIHAVDVAARCGVIFAGIRLADFGKVLIFAAFLIFGTAQQALLSMADHGRGHDARVLDRRSFRKAFPYDASLVFVATGIAMMVFAEVLFRMTGCRNEIRIQCKMK